MVLVNILVVLFMYFFVYFFVYFLNLLNGGEIMADFAYEFWERVDDLKGKGDSLSQLAQVMGVKTQSIKNMRSECRYPKPASIKCLADYLGVSVSYLISGKESSTQKEEDNNNKNYQELCKRVKGNEKLCKVLLNLVRDLEEK